MSTWECISCGASGQAKPYCEACGAAKPFEGADDSALSLVLGLVCETCDAYNDPGVPACASCGAPLGSDAPPSPPEPEQPAAATPADPPAWMSAPTGQPLASALAMPRVDLGALKSVAQGLTGPAVPTSSLAPVPTTEPALATTPLCHRCAVPLDTGDRFCRNCGARTDAGPIAPSSAVAPPTPRAGVPGLPSPVLGLGGPSTALVGQYRGPAVDPVVAGGPARPAATMVFGAATAERSAKLVLVRGQSSFGTQWRLQAGETLIGRSEGVVLFPDDDTLARQHARLAFIGGELMLSPLPSTNGVFLRVKEILPLAADDEIVIGAQRLRLLADQDRPLIPHDVQPGTQLLGSMVKAQPPISLLRICADPLGHELYHRAQRVLTLGRNQCDVNFPRDSFVSERHAQISRSDAGQLLLEDLRSRNGTYLRVRKATRLVHGDLILLGDKVLRVELPQR